MFRGAKVLFEHPLRTIFLKGRQKLVVQRGAKMAAYEAPKGRPEKRQKSVQWIAKVCLTGRQKGVQGGAKSVFKEAPEGRSRERQKGLKGRRKDFKGRGHHKGVQGGPNGCSRGRRKGVQGGPKGCLSGRQKCLERAPMVCSRGS